MNEIMPLPKAKFVAPQERRPYTVPVLKVYGAVSHLTQGGNSSAMSDAGQNMMYT
jgi:hypothetical protein